MASIGKGKTIIAGQTTEARAAYIQMRASRLDWTKTKVVTRIVELWFDAGCPPISEADAHLPKIIPPPECSESTEDIPQRRNS